MSETNAPAGWYPTPGGETRWWDGSKWTEHVAPESTSSGVVTAVGYNGTVTLDGKFVTISRTGALARMSVGKGEKRIPVRSITSVQWKPPGPMVNGFIEFSIGGGNETRSTFGRQTTKAGHNENAVIVTKNQEQQFLALRAAVEDAMAEL